MVPKIRFLNPRVRRARLRTLLKPGCAPAARAECVRLPRARGGVRPTPPNQPLPPAPSLPATARDPSPVRKPSPPPTPRAPGGRPGSSPSHAQALGCVLRPHRRRARACATPAARPEPTIARNCRTSARLVKTAPTDRPTESGGGLKARRSHPIHPPTTTSNHRRGVLQHPFRMHPRSPPSPSNPPRGTTRNVRSALARARRALTTDEP